MTLPDTREPLSTQAADQAFAAIFDEMVEDEAIIAFFSRMSERGETAVEIASAARALRSRMIGVVAPGGAIDVCGTGGDGSFSLNVSTAVAIVVAACGIPVAKHGNRAASSQAGAADTLEALGLDLNLASGQAEATLADLGIAFLFAQKHHPALTRLAPIRRVIGRRTLLNLIGPLCNPARVTRQLIGIASLNLMPVYLDAVALLDFDDVMLVAGDDPLDELSVTRPSTVQRLNCAPYRLSPEQAGLSCHPSSALQGGDAQTNAAALRAMLLGSPSAYRDAVLLNAAAALIVAGQVGDWRAGVDRAAEAIDRGLANALLDHWIAYR